MEYFFKGIFRNKEILASMFKSFFLQLEQSQANSILKGPQEVIWPNVILQDSLNIKEQVDQGLVQASLENLQQMQFHSLPRHLFQTGSQLDHSHLKKFSLHTIRISIITAFLR